MNKLENYFKEYKADSNVGNFTGNQSSTNAIPGYDFAYTCYRCGCWVNPGEYHYCYPYIYPYVSYSPQRNTTEEAFKIIKVLVKEKVIEEPESFKRFCELIEKIAKVI